MVRAILRHPNQGTEHDHETLKEAGLKEGESYAVEEIDMRRFHTYISLEGYKQSFNSVNFDFEENGEPLDIYSDERYNPYLNEE